MSDEHTKEEASVDDASIDEVDRGRRREAGRRSAALPATAFLGRDPLLRPVAGIPRLGGLVLLVALARVDPWNKSKSWRKWLRADERGWELLIPGILLAASTFLFIKAHDRWQDEGWSPEVVAMVLLASGAAIGGVLWGLFCLGLRPFAG